MVDEPEAGHSALSAVTSDHGGVDPLSGGDRLRYGARGQFRDPAAPPTNAARAGAPLVAGRPTVALDEPVSPPTSEPRSRPRDWTGPTLLVMSLGVALSALVAVRGRDNDAPGLTGDLYLASLALTFLPAAIRTLAPRARDAERFAVAVALGLLLQIERLVLYPTRFTGHDELIHLNGVRILDQSHHLFGTNPLLPVTDYYPGLEITTNAVHDLTGLSVTTSASVVLLLARIIMTLSVIGLTRVITGSMWAGCIASLIYTCNSQYVVFNSQFSYQTLALPLAIFTVYAFAARKRGGRRHLALPVLALLAVVFTHHLTSMLLIVGLAAWWLLVATLRRRTDRETSAGLLTMVVIGGIASVGWGFVPGNPLYSYLDSIVSSSADAIRGLFGGQTHQLFADSAGATTPVWERAASVMALVVVLVALILALRRNRKWLRQRNPLAISLIAVSLLYPLVPAGHLTSTTSEVTDRAAGFVFLGIAFVLAWWLLQSRITQSPSRWLSLAAAAVVLVVFMGNAILGAGAPPLRVPGPFLVASDSRSEDAANLAAARWLSHNVPRDSRVYADRDSGLLDAEVGGCYVITHVATGIDASRVLLAPTFTSLDVQDIRRADIQYVVVDQRDSESLPHLGVYIEAGEYGGDNPTPRVSSAALHKLASVPQIGRVYDNGSIVIYDVRAFDAS